MAQYSRDVEIGRYHAAHLLEANCTQIVGASLVWFWCNFVQQAAGSVLLHLPVVDSAKRFHVYSPCQSLPFDRQLTDLPSSAMRIPLDSLAQKARPWLPSGEGGAAMAV
jgi:hypothetical protein